MALPKRKPKQQRIDGRWRSQTHRTFVTREFACCMCGSTTNVVFAHYRLGSGAGLSVKPDDWRGVPLCDGPWSNIDGEMGCHDRQHVIGEPAFWTEYEKRHGQTVWDLIDSLCAESPKAAEIRAVRREREAA
jgi:hypothetical protein